MTRLRLLSALLVLSVAAGAQAKETPNHLTPFASEAAFQDYLTKVRKAEEKRQAEQERKWRRERAKQDGMVYPAPTAVPPPPAPPSAASPPAAAEAASASDAITNVQTAGVDEGGIVKKLGDYLVILRRGRLFTVKAGADELRAVDSIDAFGPGIDPAGAWYDEMLISGRTVLVIGYSYARGGTEVGLFHIDGSGKLSYRNTYHLRSNDYYSSRNYASRLVGKQLVFYSPMRLGVMGREPMLPAVRHWRDGGGEFKRILPATRIYGSGQELQAYDATLHTVTVCDIRDDAGLDCRATAVLGSSGRVFYVAADTVYVWLAPVYAPRRRGVALGDSALLRMPLSGGEPQALRVAGSPVDQLSFLERDGHINVLVGRQAGGDGMWRAEGKTGALALFRAPLSAFGGSGASSVPAQYRPLPGVNGWGLQNRFVGDWLLYGSQYGEEPAYAVAYARSGAPITLDLGHRSERIEALGGDALIVGNRGGDLVFSSIRLDGTATAMTGYIERNAAQSESRTHGFFYQPKGAREGILGLPMLAGGDGRGGAAVKYLRNRDLRLGDLGQLSASPQGRLDDGCRASCVDWYGNARPIFVGERVYALMGYELVEGRVVDGAVTERRRVDYSPRGNSR